jgi:GNAT superfamily N-acetyltransferase
MLQKAESPDLVCIYRKFATKLAQVEATRIEKNNWLINRLFVPAIYRNQGIATKLMQELTAWADTKEATLIAEINPYGDLDKEKLIEFLEKYNFFLESQEKYSFYKRAPSVLHQESF